VPYVPPFRIKKYGTKNAIARTMPCILDIFYGTKTAIARNMPPKIDKFWQKKPFFVKFFFELSVCILLENKNRSKKRSGIFFAQNKTRIYYFLIHYNVQTAKIQSCSLCTL
jgi:hypothetical protein